ncbi:Glutathione S-transferase [Ceratobasidium theobromae]|uniref:Glutathione S-transferase n=1 Tax=Ceratobasidium theobromae TaxID=1582974 RepID=A0A5N5QS75_9AGAM|nr:Glutathione S-transferase [Ceratobasidium theobromae]
MTSVDISIYPHATGEALKTVQARNTGDVDKTELVFYSGWFCPFVQRVWIALEEKGIPYLYQEENPYKKDKEFLEKFPKGLVPGILYKGKPIAESFVILEFLEDAYPQIPLLPSDPYARSQVRYAVDGVSKSILPPFYRLLQAQETDKQDEARQDLYQGLRTFATGIASPFWAGDQLTHADIALLPFIVRLPILEAHRGFKKSEVGNGFKDYVERVMNLPSVQRTLSDSQRYEEVYGRYLRNESQSEVAKSTRAGRLLP